MIKLLSGDQLSQLTTQIADIAAAEMVLSEGMSTGTPDEYSFDADDVVGYEHLNDCIAYLCSRGLAVYFLSDQTLIVQLGDFG